MRVPTLEIELRYHMMIYHRRCLTWQICVREVSLFFQDLRCFVLKLHTLKSSISLYGTLYYPTEPRLCGVPSLTFCVFFKKGNFVQLATRVN